MYKHIPRRDLARNRFWRVLECIFLELNFGKFFFLLFGDYNFNKSNIDVFLENIGRILDQNISKIDNFLLLGDFNSEVHEQSLSNFCETYNLKYIFNEPTWYKKPLKPSEIDLILTNRSRSFQDGTTIETTLPDCHKMTITVMKQYFPKQRPTLIKYGSFKLFNKDSFHSDLIQQLSRLGERSTYTAFENVFIEQLKKYAPSKVCESQ